MAEAHINTLLGASGFLGQLVQNSLSAFELWNKVGRATESADRFIVQLQFLRAKLHWWTVCWGLLDDEISPSAVPDARFEIYQDAIANYLKLISLTLQNLAACQDNASIFKSTQAANTSSSLGRLVTLLNPLSILQYAGPTQAMNDDASTLRERLEWALQNGKAMEHLTMLSDLIQDLEKFLPAPDSGLNGTVLVNPALATNVWKLRWLSRQQDFDIFTTSLAQLKATSLSQVNEFKVAMDKSSRLTGTLNYLKREARPPYLAKYNGVSVLVDRKRVPFVTDHTVLRARIEKVVQLLNSSQRIKELRSPPCLGYVYSQPGEGPPPHSSESCTYEILYSLNEMHSKSLRDMLQDDWKLPLSKRFDVARSLARSVLYLHAVEWLHKGIRSSNVVFFADQDFSKSSGFVNVSGLPYLMGFEYSRINSCDEGTEGIENTIGTSENNLYRHPDAQGEPSTDPGSYLGDNARFSKNHDIYSLGVILVELGVFKSVYHIEELLKKSNHDYGKMRGGDQTLTFKQSLIDDVVPQVELRMGAIYATVCRKCLKANFYRPDVTFDQEGAVAFYRDVIAQLERCKV